MLQDFKKSYVAFPPGGNGHASSRHPREPRNQPGHANDAKNDEEGAPAVSRHERAPEKRAQGRAAANSGSDECICESTANFRNVPHQRPRVTGIGDRFADPQHKPRGEQCRERVQAAGDSRRAGPEEKAKSHYPFDFKAICQPSGNRKEERVGPEKGGQQDAKLRGRQAKLPLQQGRGDGEVAAIDVIDKGGKGQ